MWIYNLLTANSFVLLSQTSKPPISIQSSWQSIVEKHGIHNIELYACFKRFIELYSGDENFRFEFSNGDLSRLNKINLSIDHTILVDLVSFSLLEPNPSESDVLKGFRQFMLDCSQDRVLSSKSLVSPDFELWRLAQLNRGNFLFNKKTNRQIVHAPFAIELTKGCTVGCWFCGISADSFDGASLFDQSQEFFVNTLFSLKTIAGDLNQLSFLYWATDPLDNPDYDLYLAKFVEVFGWFPQTTTAQAPKYLDKVRNIIQLTNNNCFCTVNRFSILSKAGMYKLFKEFTPLELASTLLVMQQPSSILKKADAGRATQTLNQDTAEREDKLDVNQSYQQSTIACVSGFKINLVSKSIQLISPTVSSPAYPDGFIVFAEAKLSNSYTPLDFFEDYIKSLKTRSLVISHGITYKVLNVNLHYASLESDMCFLNIDNSLDFDIFSIIYSKSLSFDDLVHNLECKGHEVFYISTRINHFILQGLISYNPD